MRCVVVGGGVVGLTTAVLLAEAGDEVEVWSALPAPATTSAVAAAIWYPYRVEPADVVLPWARRSLEAFDRLAQVPAAAVTWSEGWELFRTPVADPWWREAVPTFARVTGDDLPPGFVDGYALRLPVIVMDHYLAYLQQRLAAAGGRQRARRLDDLTEAARDADAVVNCAGIGARRLVPDPLLRPVRGQVVVVRNPGLERFLIDADAPAVTYIIPRGDDCVLGGTAEEGAWDLAPQEDTAAGILRRCISLEPRLAGVDVLDHRVGLRPARAPVRLERTAVAGTPVVHQYGHGGAGVTLSWGSAAAAVNLLRTAA